MGKVLPQQGGVVEVCGSGSVPAAQTPDEADGRVEFVGGGEAELVVQIDGAAGGQVGRQRRRGGGRGRCGGSGVVVVCVTG